MRDDSHCFTPSRINLIACEVAEGKADAEEARALLTLFCQCVQQGSITALNTTARRLLDHVSGALDHCLKGDKTIEAALGFGKRRGRPQADEQLRIQMAASVLGKRLDGVRHQEALELTAKRFGYTETIIAEAYRDNLAMATIAVSLERGPWSERDRQILARISADRNKRKVQRKNRLLV